MRGFGGAAKGRKSNTNEGGGEAHARGGLYDEVREHLGFMFDVVAEGAPRKRSLRSSSLPYCPVLDTVLPREPDEMDLNGALYTSMGTAAHTALQAFATLGAPGTRVWGNWKCPRCSHEWKTPCFRPDSCPSKCNDAPIYVELTFQYGIMSGHCDLVVQYSGGHWCVHEYKTIGRQPRQPKRQHLLQARTYCAMLKRQYGITASYVLVYIGRENLAVWPFGPYDSRPSAQQTHDWCSRAIAGFRAASAARRIPSKANLMEVARCRPCTDVASHDDYMARRYSFSTNPCEMLGNCCKSDGHVARIMHALLEE